MTNPAASDSQQNKQTAPVTTQIAATPKAASSEPVGVAGSMAKEQMPLVGDSKEVVQNVATEAEVSPEVSGVGVKAQKENVEVPPDLKKMGVSSAGPTVPVINTASVKIILPISDDQIETGLHMQIYSALRWLAEWCIKKLKKAHLTLKIIHGKVMRVPYKNYE